MHWLSHLALVGTLAGPPAEASAARVVEEPTTGAVSSEGPRAQRDPAEMGTRRGARARERTSAGTWPFMFALGVTGIQAPILRSSVIPLDPRATGRATTMVGGAAFFRWVPRANERLRNGPWVGLDVGFRSGSVRFRETSTTGAGSVAHDLFAFESAALLYLFKSQFARLALDAGGGGMLQRVRYDLASEDASSRFGSGFVRLGASVEVLVSRVAFVFDLRGYGVITDRRHVVHRGEAFTAAAVAVDGERSRAPVPTLQTMLVGSAALAFRF